VVQRLLQLPPLQRAEAAGAAYGGSGVVCRAVHHFAFAACWQALGEPSLHLASRPPLRVHKHLTPSARGEEEDLKEKCMQNNQLWESRVPDNGIKLSTRLALKTPPSQPKRAHVRDLTTVTEQRTGPFMTIMDYVYLSRWPRHAAGEGRAVTPDGLSAVQRARSKSSP
jgi:hypothetical protein